MFANANPYVQFSSLLESNRAGTLKSLTCVFQNLSQTWLLRQLLSDFRDEEKSVLITPSSSELVRLTFLL